jgi:hypothetical protein
VTLDGEDIEAVATRVLELLGEQSATRRRYVDAAALARTLGVDRDWIYARARALGAVRLGDGPRARLRFDLDAALAKLDPPPSEQRAATGGSARPGRRRPRPRLHSPGIPLIRGRSGR